MRYWVFYLCGLSLLLLSGCQPVARPAVNTIDDTLPKKVSKASDVAVIRQINELQKQNVTVITMGQDYLISFPASRVFSGNSPRILWEGYPVLDRIVDFLANFRKVSVTITGYGIMHPKSPRREFALSKARAEAVANYLWTRGMDSRLVFTRGAGSVQPIIVAGTKRDRRANARIEITFTDVVA